MGSCRRASACSPTPPAWRNGEPLALESSEIPILDLEGHTFGTLKAWMGATHFRSRTLEKVRTEISLHVLANNLRRVIAILGVQPLMAAMRA